MRRAGRERDGRNQFPRPPACSWSSRQTSPGALAERTRAGLVKRHEAGFHTGGPPPYGYRVVPTADGRKKLGRARGKRPRRSAGSSTNTGRGSWAERNRTAARTSRAFARASVVRGASTTIRGIITNRMLVGEVVYLPSHVQARPYNRQARAALKTMRVRIGSRSMIASASWTTTRSPVRKRSSPQSSRFRAAARNQVRAFTRLLFWRGVRGRLLRP
jgi:hypothetical protein